MSEAKSNEPESNSDSANGIAGALNRIADTLEKPTPWWERYSTPLSVLVSALVLFVTVLYAEQTLRTSIDQFESSSRTQEFSEIVAGLQSPAVAVQVSSIRKLEQYVNDPTNYDGDDDDQADAQVDAAQILAAFVQDESHVAGEEGLSDFRDPQPIVLSRAMNEIIDLVGETNVDIDISQGNLHGVHAPDFTPHGAFLARNADFRMATVTGWDLREVRSAELRAAFFTCANLKTAEFGSARVDDADFMGANLRGADLSEVSGLTADQLRGALIGPSTKLPVGVAPPARSWGWTQDSTGDRPTSQCRRLVEGMTRLVGGAGYTSRFGCDGGADSGGRLSSIDPIERKAIERVCTLRDRLDAS